MKTKSSVAVMNEGMLERRENTDIARLDLIFILGEKHRKQSVVKNDLLFLTTDCHCSAFPSKQKHMLRWK